LVTDLLFATRIVAAGNAIGAPVRIIRTTLALAAAAGTPDASGPLLLLVDLDLAGADPLEAIRMAHAGVPQLRIVAFGSHVQAELLRAARDAGADPVLPRSAFVACLDELLGSA
jgi:DNA-binding NarL/FixJ family response regulator